VHRPSHSTFLSMSLASIMRHFLATLYLLQLWHLPQTQRQQRRKVLAKPALASKKAVPPRPCSQAAATSAYSRKEVAAPSKGEPGKRGSAFLGIPFDESTAGKHRCPLCPSSVSRLPLVLPPRQRPASDPVALKRSSRGCIWN